MIRLPTQNDLLSVGHVYCEAWKAAYRGIVPDKFLDGLTDESCAPRSVRTKGALVYEKDGIVVGAASFGALRDSDGKQTGELYSIYVLPEYWRNGAGKALFEAVRNELRADGYSTMFLWTLSKNHRARQFYEKMGMNAASERIIVIGGRELLETGYAQTLSAFKQQP